MAQPEYLEIWNNASQIANVALHVYSLFMITNNGFGNHKMAKKPGSFL